MKIQITLFMFFVILLIFSACSSNGNFVYQELLSKEEGKYSVYIVANEDIAEEAHDILFSPGYNRINSVRSSERDEIDNLPYPGLDIEEFPVFFLFDNKNIVHQSYDLTEFISFIDEYLDGKY